jgi:hypothetical protein
MGLWRTAWDENGMQDNIASTEKKVVGRSQLG